MQQSDFPASAVNVALQSRDGHLWFGTSAGLFNFDGMRFTEVRTDTRDSSINEKISTLCETKDGSLWIGTTFGGLRRLINGRIILYGREDGLPQMEIKRLCESRTGRLWVGTDYGLFIYESGRFKQVPINPSYITAITKDKQGKILVGTHDGVRIFKDADLSLCSSITVADGLPDKITTCICVDRKSRIWIGTESGMARREDGKLQNYTMKNGLSNLSIRAIYEDKDGNIWVGTRYGLNRFYEGVWTTFMELDGLSNNYVSFFEEDREGGLWACTSAGLDQFKDVNVTAFTMKEGLANDYISTIAQTPDGSIYFLSNAGKSITRLKNGRFTKYTSPVGTAYVAHDSSLWIGQNGLLLNLKNNKIKKYDKTTGLPQKWISAITQDNKSIIVFIDSIGLKRFINGNLKPFLLEGGKQYPAERYITCLYTQPDGTLWVGTTDGLAKIENGHYSTFTTEDGLAGNWTSSIHQDRKGDLWISSPQGGLTHYKNGKFIALTTKAGLFTNEIYCVLEDDMDDIWLSSPRGIGCLHRKELDDYEDGRVKLIHTQVFLIADGMKTGECFGNWQPSGYKTSDGHIWFGTKKGAVMIDPDSIKKNELKPPVVIENIFVDQQPVSGSQSANFPAGTDKIEFHYAALSYLIPNRVLFKYKLEGYEHEWQDAKTRRDAYYMNLSPGEYRFRVIACNNDGLWNEKGTSFSFIIEPYFTQTYWFYAIVLILLVGLIIGIVRLRIWRHIKREKVLQARIQEALLNIKALSGLIPICSSCKKIRNDKGYWDHLEVYIQSHSEAQFSHGICPDCIKKLYSHIDLTEDTLRDDSSD